MSNPSDRSRTNRFSSLSLHRMRGEGRGEGWRVTLGSRLKVRLLTSAATTAFALSASAHPGHDWAAVDARHLVTSPDHLAVLALAGVVLCLGARFVQARWPRRMLQGAGLVAVAVAAVVWGLRA